MQEFIAAHMLVVYALAVCVAGIMLAAFISLLTTREMNRIDRQEYLSALSEQGVVVKEMSPRHPSDKPLSLQESADLEIARELEQIESSAEAQQRLEVPAYLRRGLDTYEANRSYLERLVQDQVRTRVREEAVLKQQSPRAGRFYPPKLAHSAPERSEDRQSDVASA